MEEIPPEIEQGEDELRRCIARAAWWDESCEEAGARLAGAMRKAGITHKEMIRRFRALRLSRRGAAKLISDARRYLKRKKRRDAHRETATGLAWPDVIGVLSIVVGAKWLLWPQWWVQVESLGDLLTSEPVAAFLSRLRSLPSPLGLAMAASGVVQVGWLLLVVAGVMLWRRRRTGALLHTVAACIVCLGTIVSSMAWLCYLGGESGATPELLIPVAIGRAAVLIYPTFVLIWFRRRRIRQQVVRWRTVQGRLESRPDGPVWPFALGTVSIVFAAMRILTSTWLWSSWAWTRHPPHYVSAEWVTKARFMVSAETLELALLGLLIVAGALLIRKARSAILLHQVYAVLAALHVVGAATLRAWLIFEPGATWRILGTQLYGLIATTAFRLVYPVFLLVWLGRASIRRQVRDW